MAVSVCYALTLRRGDALWATLLPGRDPVCVTVVGREVLGHAHDPDGVQFQVRTTMGNLVWIMHEDILRRAS